MIKLFFMLKPYRISIILIAIFIFMQCLAQLYLPTLMANMVNDGMIKGDIQQIWNIGGWMLLAAIGVTLCAIVSGYLSARVAGSFAHHTRKQMFARVQALSLQQFDALGTSSLLTRTTNDITQLQSVLFMMLRFMFMAPLLCLGGMVMAFSKDVELSLVLVVALPLLGAAIAMIVGKTIPIFRTIQKRVDRLNLVLREYLMGMRVVRAFNQVEREDQRFAEASLDVVDGSMKVNRLMAITMPLMMLLMSLCTVSILWIGGFRVQQGYIDIGNLLAFIQYAAQISFAFMLMAMIIVMIPRAAASSERIHEVLHMQIMEQQREVPTILPLLIGKIEFRGVYFRYPGAECCVLNDVSFCIRPGETIAIIGGTGSGKTTLLHLIMNFYDATEGSVRVHGVDVCEWSKNDLRVQMGFVPQKALLLTGTICDNIAYGKEEATFEEVRHASRVAQSDSFVQSFPDTYDHFIAQGGNNLSGGQQQRLCIARALIRKPSIYMFDDSFSALDGHTDAQLQAALKQETLGATVLIVTQRVSTIVGVDRIFVMHEGSIVGQGTHAQLLANNTVYQEIVASQRVEEDSA